MGFSTSSKKITVFTLVMMNIIAVDSLRSLSMGAVYGYTLLAFYALAAVLFFIPSILVTAELATAFPITGGVYIWVREAFGQRFGFLAIWLQWIYNVVWFPTIFAFVASTLTAAFAPSYANNPYVLLSIVLIAFWSITFINTLGIEASSKLSTMGAVLGTLLPMLVLIGLGVAWFSHDQSKGIAFDAKNFLPNFSDLHNVAFLTNVLFGLMGMEMSAVHAGDVRNPAKNFPKALAYSGGIIIITLIAASLAIAMVIPQDHINLLSDIVNALNVFFGAYHLPIGAQIVTVLIVIGSLAGAGAWLLGPARGLHIASISSALPSIFSLKNKQGMPIGILLIQGLVATALMSAFVLMPSVSGSYWLLSNLTAQLALLFYILLFASAIRLRHKRPHKKTTYRIPGGNWGMNCVAGIGILTCLSVIILGFFPPEHIATGSQWRYESLLIGGMILFTAPAFWFSKKKHLNI